MLSAAKLLSNRSSVRSLASLRDNVKKIRSKELYEPIFKDVREYPEYDVLNVRLQSFDYGPLETFQAYAGKIAKRFGFKIVESYPVAAMKENVLTYKRGSVILDSNIELTHYDRWIRLQNVPAVKLPVFLSLLRTHAPIGIRISVREYTKEDEDCRYIPDVTLKERQEELKSLDNIMVRKALDMSSSELENLSDSSGDDGETTNLKFSPSISIHGKLQSGEYQRKTFAPHKEFDIFCDGLSDDQILERLARFIEERKENEQSNIDKDELNQLFEQFRFQKSTFAKRSGYKPEDIKLRRADENNYDPDADPNYESHDEDAYEIEQYFKEMKKKQCQNNVDGKEFNGEPPKQVILCSNNIGDEEFYSDPDECTPRAQASKPSSKKVERNPLNEVIKRWSNK
ncbi:39S ribosomal protein L48, mitochondrial [Aphelenchoides bicaudatus]|nr:39S ribosomal protein L48, mitochondrial [Aphelenchoides bicaudatus]